MNLQRFQRESQSDADIVTGASSTGRDCGVVRQAQDERKVVIADCYPLPSRERGDGFALVGVERDWMMSSQVGGLGCWSMAVLIADSSSDTRRRSRNRMRLAEAGLASAMRSPNT